MKIFSGSSNKTLAEKVARQLGLRLSGLEIHVFPDKEKRIRVIENVVDKDTVVVQSCSTPADSNYMELFFIVDALKRSGAKKVTAVVPYLGYQRQDHIFRDGEAVSLEVVVKTLEATGMDRLIAFDLHSIKIPELFSIPVIHLSALSIFAEEIKKYKWSKNDTVLVSPDMGGIRRIKLISEMLSNMPFATIVKERNLSTGEVSTQGIKGSVGKRAIIIDDMISSGGTIVSAADLLSKKGVSEIYVFATHAVLSENAPALLQKSAVKKVFVTDTINISKAKRFPKLEILSVSEMIVEEIRKS
ncbi:MAG: ribose-phosphate pyrophosphokinase [bacterium]|nr:ribose-phosphate pyrophosphokinase [bacterium]